MNAGAVISNVDTKDKLPYFSPAVQPAASFLDPTNTFSVPAYQTASGSVDIMAHIFDMVYFSRQPRMDMIYRVQDEVLKTVVKFAPIALKEPDNYEARANLIWASTWALNGFLAGVIVSHMHYWYHCPVCHDCQYCQCDCHDKGCEQCH